MEIIEKEISSLVLYARNPRKNDETVAAVAASIKEFGFRIPILIDPDNVIICGHTRVKAARSLDMKSVPAIVTTDLTPQQVKAFRIIDNKLTENSKWDYELLQLEFQELDLKNTALALAFDPAEMEVILQAAWEPPESTDMHESEGLSDKTRPITVNEEQRRLFEDASIKVAEQEDNPDLTEGEALAVICTKYLE